MQHNPSHVPGLNGTTPSVCTNTDGTVSHAGYVVIGHQRIPVRSLEARVTLFLQPGPPKDQVALQRGLIENIQLQQPDNMRRLGGQAGLQKR